MVTLFAIPKPFVGHSAVIQHNAVASWKKFHPDYQIILFGNEEGIAEAACEHGVEHIPDVKRNALGTPLLNAVFEHASDIARFPILCYVNSDIMLLDDLNAAVERVKNAGNFLMVGQRWNLDVDERIDFSEPEINQKIRQRTMQHGTLAMMWAMDYFVYPKELGRNLPTFAIGRPGWDNWMLFLARKKNFDLINSSLLVMAVHQNHPPAYSETGVEAKQNRQTGETTGMKRAYSLLDSTHLLTPFSIQSATLRKPEDTATDIDIMPKFIALLKNIYRDNLKDENDAFFYRHLLASAHWYEANLLVQNKRYVPAVWNILSAQRIIPHGYPWTRLFKRLVKESKRYLPFTAR